MRVNSAELTRLLRLDQSVVLYPAERIPLAVTLVSTDAPLPELIAQGLSTRPELARDQALVAEAQARLRQERWRPWVPNIYLATSAGGFGGGPNDFFGNFEGRKDFDALAVWSFENLGLGNHARQREQASVQRQRLLEFQRTYDRVAAEIAQAYARAQIRREQVEVAEAQVAAAAEALPLNFRGIRGGELRPIEAQQAIKQLAEARQRYLAAVIEYDQAQLRLLRAIGQPPSTAAARPAAAALSSPPLDDPPAPASQE